VLALLLQKVLSPADQHVDNKVIEAFSYAAGPNNELLEGELLEQTIAGKQTIAGCKVPKKDSLENCHQELDD
jgi:hypothetical protein